MAGTANGFKWVGDLAGNSKPVTMTVPLDNVEIHVGDAVTIANSAAAGYCGLCVTSKPMLGVVTGFVHKDGRPITPNDAGGHTVTPSSGPVADSVTASSDGAALAQVSVSPTAIYSVASSATPTTTTYYGGTGCAVTVTTGAQYITLGTPGTTTDLDTMIIPYGTGMGLQGIDVQDNDRVYVIFSGNELFWGSYAVA